MLQSNNAANAAPESAEKLNSENNGAVSAAADTDTAAVSRRETAGAVEAAAEPSPDTRREEFERLIAGEYKDAFTERVSGIINRRFAQSKRGEGEHARLSREQASDAVAASFAEQCMRAADGAEELYSGWLAAAEEVGRDYPGFSVEDALKEPAFGKLLRAGVDLRSAYEATHMQAVREQIRAAAAADAQARTLDAVRLRGLRPDENGARPGAGIVTGGMASLSRRERAEIANKAMRGLL